ncbi:MAG: BlaI/MecI/CopY family transcriptional regulator [Bdellovibrionota bacterium]
MKKKPGLGEQEMEILKFIEGRALSVKEVAAHFKKEKNLARTTILTMMERLRKKGFLARLKKDGLFRYTSKVDCDDVVNDKISDFVERTLGGSFSPLLAHFSSSKVSSDELQELKNLVSRLTKKGDVR